MYFKVLNFPAALFVLLLISSAYGQETSPSPTPIEIKPDRPAKRAALDSLKTSRDKPFESAEGRFRIDLPQRFLSYRPSQVFGQNAITRFGTIEWNLEEAEIVIRFGMLPPGT